MGDKKGRPVKSAITNTDPKAMVKLPQQQQQQKGPVIINYPTLQTGSSIPVMLITMNSSSQNLLQQTNTVSTGVNMNLLKELINKSFDMVKQNNRSRSFNRQKFEQILTNLQKNLVLHIEANQSKLLINENVTTAAAAAAHDNTIIQPSSSTESKEIIVIDSPEQKSTVKMDGDTNNPNAMMEKSVSNVKNHPTTNSFEFPISIEKSNAKRTKKKQKCTPKRQKPTTTTTTTTTTAITVNEISSGTSRFADIDSDDDIEIISEITHNKQDTNQPKPPKIITHDHNYAYDGHDHSSTENENEDNDEEMNKDHDQSTHMDVMQKMLEELKQDDDENDEKPVVAITDSQEIKSTQNNLHKTDMNNNNVESSFNNDDDNSSMSRNVYTRHCIREIRGFSDLNVRAQQAIRDDIERCERLKEKKNFLEKFLSKISDNNDRLILDIDNRNGKILVEVDEGLVQILKPHQKDGIQFMFDCTIESVDRLKNHSHQTGCILAHSMGLGKTLQAIAYLHTVMTNDYLAKIIRKALIIVPYNVYKNWLDEIQQWFDECRRYIDVARYELSRSKSISERLETLKDWHRTGGILVMTIGTFTRLVLGRSFHEEELPDGMTIINNCLLTPDVFIMDEGHLLRNSSSQINRAASKIVTLRRIILTGTPMQNNLNEYFVMVDFVKPNLLGTIQDFRNRFINPITNGQHIDSTKFDVNFMKKRVHVLHTMLQPSIHRCDYQVLVPYLPPKQEYIVYVQLTEIQSKLYQYYLDNITKKSQQCLFKDFWILLLLNNHPALLIDMYEKQYNVTMDNDYTIGNNDDYDDDISKTNNIIIKDNNQRKIAQNNNNNNNNNKQWWTNIIDEKNARCIELSAKFIIMFAIIDECQKLNDKLIIFSQSLINLNMIELMLSKCLNVDWIRNVDYFRIDGNVTVEARHRIIQTFNDESNRKARLLLLSTRSGGIGINLVGANRCIIFDCSWNPAHDTQAIFRIFRYGQHKPCFIYRLAGYGTMENRIYQRQVSKLSISKRVVDEKQIRRYFTSRQLEELYTFMRRPITRQTLPVPKDDLLASLVRKYSQHILLYYEHDSLLQNRPEEELSEAEKQQAWIDWEQNRHGNTNEIRSTQQQHDYSDDDDFQDPDDYRSLLY